jgi:enterochelin esterase-like enzyme
MIKRTIVRETIQSQSLGTNKEIHISLPPDYNQNQTYPLLILHDGPDYFNLGRIVTQANQLMVDGKIKQIVMVAVPVDKAVRTQEYSPIGERNQAHKEFIMNELLPFLEENYPVDLSTENLVIGGSSLGGTVSLHLALDYPEQVQNVLSQSGAFLEATKEQIQKTSSLSYLTIYQSIGLKETAVPTHMGTIDLVTRNREVYELLRKKNAHVYYIEEDGDHTWGFWQKELPRALGFFFGTENPLP